MRATCLQFRSPKEETPGATLVNVSSIYNLSINHLPQFSIQTTVSAYWAAATKVKQSSKSLEP